MSILSFDGNSAVPARRPKRDTMKGLETLATPMRPLVLAKYLGVFSMSLVPIAAVPAVVSLGFREYQFAANCGLVAVALGGAGFPLTRLPSPRDIQQNEAMAVIALGFLLAALAMSWPFATAGLPPLDAFFEAVSAVTTTGLSATGGIAGMSAGFLFARAWAQWFGGLAIIVLAFMVVLGPGVIARRLTLSDTGPEDLLGGTWQHGKRVIVIYGGLTLAGGVLLWAFGASPFDATVHALASLSTGGFSSLNDSVAGFDGPLIRALVLLLCITGAISFTLQYNIWRSGPVRLLRDGEVRTFAVTILLVWAMIVLSEWLAGANIDAGFAGNAAFMAISAQTTAGFDTTDPANFSSAAKLALIFSMAVGGDTGSTAGGLKIFRLIIVLRLIQLLLGRTLAPRHAVLEPRVGGRSLAPDEIATAGGVIALYVLTILISWFCFLIAGLDPLNSMFDVVSAIGTVGLSTGVTGPALAAPLKLLLCLDMLMGRLEILAVIILVYPMNWFGQRRERS